MAGRPLVLLTSLLVALAACGNGSEGGGPGHDAVTGDTGVTDPGEWEPDGAADVPVKPRWVYLDKAYAQERTRWYTTDNGLPSNHVRSVFPDTSGKVLVGTEAGLARLEGDTFTALNCPGYDGPVIDAVADGGQVAFLAGQSLWVRSGEFSCQETLLPSIPNRLSLVSSDPMTLLIAGNEGVYGWSGGPVVTIPGTDGMAAREAVDLPGSTVAVATDSCLVLASTSADAYKLCGAQGLPSDDVRAVTLGPDDLLWIGTAQGLASWKPGDAEATPYTGGVGALPYDDITRMSVGPSGTVAAGTPLGTLVREAHRWHVIHGRNLVPANEVLDIAVDADDQLWVATAEGLARVYREDATLEAKAGFFDEATHLRHNRMGMVSPCILDVPGDTSSFRNRDDDNDGQWTGMYLGSQCFRCAVTGDSEACQWARTSMEAMLRLEEITEVPGFFARSYVEGDRCDEMNAAGGEWHLTSDEQWCWKGDTSTDEFVGHVFGLSIYHDLLADDVDKARIAATIGRILDRIIAHGYYIADLDGLCTSDGHFDPGYINLIGQFGDAGLNSAMILGGLRFGEWATGDPKYGEAHHELVNDHGYADNVRRMLEITHAFWINHDSHEMIFLAFYPLLVYETDPELRAMYLQGLEDIWQNQRPENNPEFNMIYTVLTNDDQTDLDVTIRSLKEMPPDLVIWNVDNSQRKDYELDPEPDRFGEPQALTVFPYDERHVMKWNQNPYRLEGGGTGHAEETGTHWLLPYWMGRHHGFIRNPQIEGGS